MYISLVWFFVMAMVSCDKDLGETPYERIVRYEPSLSMDEYHALVSEADPVYVVDDLLMFLSAYGKCEVDVVPAFGNYFQDIGVGGSLMGNLTLVGGEPMFSPSGVVLVDTTGYAFGWYVNDDLVYSYSNPKVSDIFVCSGVFRLRLDIDTPFGSLYSREEWAFLGSGTGVITCPCEGCPFFFEVFYEFYPDVAEFHFREVSSHWDFTGDGCVGMGDLLIFLSLFGGG